MGPEKKDFSSEIKSLSQVKQRLARAVILLISLLLGIVFILGWLYATGVMKDEEQLHAQILTRTIAQSIAHAGAFESGRIRSLLDEIRQDENDVIYLRIVDKNGLILSSTREHEINSMLDDKSMQWMSDINNNNDETFSRILDDELGVVLEVSAAWQDVEDKSSNFMLQAGTLLHVRNGEIQRGVYYLVFILLALALSGTFLVRSLNKFLGDPVKRLANDMAATLQALPDMLYELDSSGRYLRILSYKGKMLEKTRQRYLGRTIYEVLPPEAAVVVEEAISEASEQGESHGYQFLLSLPHGDRWFELSVARKNREQLGDDNRFIVLSRNVTERKQSETEIKKYRDQLEELVTEQTARIRDNEKNYRALFEGSNDAIIVFWQGHFVDCNKAALELFGCDDVETFKTLTPIDISTEFQPDGTPSLQAQFDRIEQANRDGSVIFEWRHQRLDNQKPFTAEVLISATRWHGQDATQAVVRDISERKLTELKLKKSIQIAQSTSQLKSDFVANVSHEIRTPMNAIIGFSEIILQQNELTSSVRHNVENIHRSSKALLSIINDILDLSKLESGKFDLESISFSLPLLISEVLKTLEIQASRKGLYLDLDTQQRIPDYVSADPTRLRQILFNLIGNAIKFTEQGGITLKMRYLPKEQMMYFTVKDTGIGMTAEQIGRIFDKFSQADESTTRRFGGTGLGTSISKQLVEKMGGQIRVESQPQKGSSFQFNVRMVESNEQVREEETAQGNFVEVTVDKPVCSPHQDEKGNLKEGILLVEDNLFNQDLISQQLTACGYQVDIASNGKVALDKLETKNYDLILSDISMPVMDGYELVKNIRQLEHKTGRRMPMVAMTANAMEGERERCIAAGFDAYLPKPVDLKNLKQTVSRWYHSENEAVKAVEQVTSVKCDTNINEHEFTAFDPGVLAGLVHDLSTQKQLLQVFLEDAPLLLGVLLDQMEQMDFPAMAASAHKLKSSARAIGAEELVAHLQAIEQTGKDKDESIVVEIRDLLQDLLDKIISEINLFMESLPETS